MEAILLASLLGLTAYGVKNTPKAATMTKKLKKDELTIEPMDHYAYYSLEMKEPCYSRIGEYGLREYFIKDTPSSEVRCWGIVKQSF